MSACSLYVVLFATLGMMMPAAQAQGLADPTRPPGAGAMQGSSQDEPPPGRQLQSVLLSSGRKLAVIDGVTVPLGGKLGDARVVKITESEVVLKTGEETETLKLFPGVDKQPVKRAAGRARAGTRVEVPSTQGGSK